MITDDRVVFSSKLLDGEAGSCAVERRLLREQVQPVSRLYLSNALPHNS